MSATIDERIVQMSFNNKDFEKNAATSLNTIAKLKQALDFSGAEKGLDNVNSSVKAINFNSMGNGIETVRVKFKAWEVAAIAAINNVVNRATNAGLNFAKSFTLDPIMSGFSEYENKMGSIQTILANTSQQTAEVSSSAIAEVNAAAEAAAQESEQLNQQAIQNLQKRHSAETKALAKSAQEQTKALTKRLQAEQKAFEESAQAEAEALEKSEEKRLEKFEKQASKEVKAVEKKYNQEYKALQKEQQKELAALDAKHEAEMKAFEKAADEQLDALEDAYDDQLKALEANTKAELKALEDAYDDEYKALKKAQERELKTLKDQHNAKLDMYHEEYMEQLRVADEDRYNQIKAIDDQIDSIEGLTKAEEEEAKAAAQRQKLQELEQAVISAQDILERARAEKELAEYKDELAREQILKERQNQIDQLESQKAAINSAYELKKQQIEEEYEARKAAEDDLYSTQTETMKEAQEEQRSAAQELYEERKELIKEQSDLQKEAIKDEYDTQKAALQEQLEAEKEKLQQQQDLEDAALEKKYKKEQKAIDKRAKQEQKAVEKRQQKEQEALQNQIQKEQEALADKQEDERQALSDRQENERQALADRQEAASEALQERQQAELDAMDIRHQQELLNIEAEKKARLSDLRTEANNVKAPSLDDVTKALDELNEYSDKTIYNFEDMTRNIGTFTAAGVDLDTSVSAIKGIANLAAVSGSSSQQASTAMYQLSQAIATGTVKLQDWNSVTNAGMGGKVFQNSLLETARVHGIAVDDMIAEEGSFRDSLQEGWLSSEILLETLSKFTGDLTKEQLKSMGYTDDQISGIIDMGNTAVRAASQVKTFSQLIDTSKEAAGSGWAETFEIVIGNFDEAKELWSGVSQEFDGIIQKSSDARNDLLRNWKDAGGRDMLIEGLGNAWTALKKVLDPVKEAFSDIFPPTTAFQLLNITEKFKDFTAKLSISKETSDKLKSAFSGLFTVVGLVGDAFKFVFDLLKPAGGLIQTLAGYVLDAAANFGDWITNIRDSAKESELFKEVIDKIKDAAKTAFEKLTELLKNLKDPLTTAKDKAKELFDSFVAGFKDTKDKGKDAKDIFVKIKDKVKEMVDKVKEFFSFDGVKDSFDGVEGDATSFMDRIKELLSFEWFGPIVDTVKEKFSFLGDGVTAVKDGIEILLDWAKQAVEILEGGAIAKIGFNLSDFIKTVTKTKKEKGKGIAGIFDTIKESIKSLTDFITDNKDGKGLTGAMTAIQDSIIGTFGAIQSKLKAQRLVPIATAIAILALALKEISDIPIDQLSNALGGIAGLFAELFGAVGLFEKWMKGFQVESVKGIGTSLLTISGSVWILAQAMKALQDMDPKTIGATFFAVEGLVASLAGSVILISKYGDEFNTSALSLVGMAAGVWILAEAAKSMSKLSPDDLAKGLGAVVVLTGAIDTIALATENGGLKASNGFAILEIAAAMLIFESAMRKIGQLSLPDLIKGLGGMASVLIMVTTAMNEIPDNATSIAGGMLIMSAALVVMAGALKTFSSIDPVSMAVGLVGMGSSLVMLAYGANEMKDTKDGSTAMLIMAAAMLVLAPALKIMSSMDLPALGMALATLAGVFVVMGTAAKILEPLAPTMLEMSKAIALLGVGLLAFATGLTALAAASAATIAAVLANIRQLVIGGIGIIADAMPAIAELMINFVKAVCDVLQECIPDIVEAVMTLIDEVLKSLAEHMPSIGENFYKLILSVLDVIETYVPDIIVKLVETVSKVFAGVIEALKDVDTKTLEEALAGVALVAALILAMSKISLNVGEASKAIAQVAVVIGELGLLLAAIGALNKIPGISDLMESGGEFLLNLGSAIGKFIGGIIGGFAEGISDSFPQIGQNLGDFMENAKPFIEGAGGIDKSVLTGVGYLTSAIFKITAADLLQGLVSAFTGESSLVSFGNDLVTFGRKFKAYSEEIKDIDANTVIGSARAAQALSDMANTLPNKGGIVAWFTGDNTLSSFAEELEAFGPAMADYAAQVSGINATEVTASAYAAQALAGMANNLPTQKTTLNRWLTGDNSLSTFGEELEAFGPSIKTYSDSVSGIDSDAVTASASAAQLLANLESALPEDNNAIVDFFTGSTDLSSFGEKLADFGGSLTDYYESIKTIDADKLTSVVDNIDDLVDIATKTANIDTSGLGNFSYDLLLMAENGMDSFIAEFENSETDVTNAINAVVGYVQTALTNRDKDMKDYGSDSGKQVASGIQSGIESKTVEVTDAITKFTNGIGFAFTGALTEDTYKTIGSDTIGYLIDGLGSKDREMNTQITTLITNINTAFTNGLPEATFEGYGSGATQDIIDGMNSKEQSLKDKADTLADDIKDKIKTGLPQNTFETYGERVPTGLKSGIKSGELLQSYPTNVADTLATNIKNAISNTLTYNAFYSIGENIGKGLAAGITSKEQTVKTATTNLVSAATKTTTDILIVQSPSKLFAWYGEMTGQGLANGMLSKTEDVAAASEDMTMGAVDPLKDAMNSINDMFSEDADYTPVITPIIDLTEATNGARQVSSMFTGLDLTSSIGLAESAGASFMRPRRTSSEEETNKKLNNTLDRLIRATEDDSRIQNTNHFYIQSSNPQQVASEVDHIMQHRVERRRAAWAR